VFEETFNTVGVPLDIRAPERQARFIDGKADRCRPRRLVAAARQLTNSLAHPGKFADARSGNLPMGGNPTEDWLRATPALPRCTHCSAISAPAIFACTPNELPAAAFLTIHQQGRVQRFGFCPQGTIGVERARDRDQAQRRYLAHTPATQILPPMAASTAVTVLRDGQHIRIDTELVISNAGPKTTVALAAKLCSRRLSRKSPHGLSQRPTSSSISPAASADFRIPHRQPSADAPALQHGQPPATCPELARRAGIPMSPMRADPGAWRFRLRRRVELALMDLREHFPIFSQAKICRSG